MQQSKDFSLFQLENAKTSSHTEPKTKGKKHTGKESEGLGSFVNSAALHLMTRTHCLVLLPASASSFFKWG